MCILKVIGAIAVVAVFFILMEYIADFLDDWKRIDRDEEMEEVEREKDEG